MHCARALANCPGVRDVEPFLVAMQDVEMVLPVAIGDYTDFYASIFHATNVGKLFRPDNPLLPNYKHIPIGYHGRASSIVVSGTPVRRPRADSSRRDATSVRRARWITNSKSGFFIGGGNALGEPIPIEPPRSTCSASAWSTTGRRAIYRRGNTSRSVRFSARASLRDLALGDSDGGAGCVSRCRFNCVRRAIRLR